MSLAKNTAWSAVAAIVLTCGRFLINILLANKLGLEEYGKFAFSQWLVDVVFLSLAFGLQGSASRFYAELRNQSANLTAFEKWFLRRSLIVAAAVAVASPIIAQAFNGKLDLQIGFFQACWSTSAAVWTLLLARAQGLQQFQRIAMSNLAYVAIALGGSVIIVRTGASVSSAILLITAATIVAIFFIWLKVPVLADEKIVSRPDLNLTMIKNFGINIWITSLVSALVWSRGELLIVRSEMGVDSVAVYSIALSLAGIATQGLMILTGALGPHLTQMWGDGKSVEAIDLCRRITDILTLSAGILTIFLTAFAPELIRYTYGPAYAVATVTLSILGIGTIGLTSAAANQLLQIKTNGVYSRNINLVGAVCLYMVAILMTKLLGINGAALSRIFTQIAIGSISLYFAYRLVSAHTVKWLNQIKMWFIVMSVIIFHFMEERTLYTRILEFGISSFTLLFWLRTDNGHPVYSSLIGRFNMANFRNRNNR